MTFCYTSGILLIVTNVRTLYILTTNTVSVFPAKFIKYSLLLTYFSYLLIVGNTPVYRNSNIVIFEGTFMCNTKLKKVRIIGKKCAHNL